jgi:hypothetical protein
LQILAASAARDGALTARQRIERGAGFARLAGLVAVAAPATRGVLAAGGLLVAAIAVVVTPAPAAAPAALPVALLLIRIAALIVAATGFYVVAAAVAIIIAVIIITVIVTLLIIHNLQRIDDITGNCTLGRLQLPTAFRALHPLTLHGRAALALLLEQPVARHRRHHDAEVMFRMLQKVLVLYPVAGRLRVAGVLGVLFVDLRGRAPDFHIRTIALKRSVAVVVTATTAAAGLAPAPPLTLHETILIFRIFAPVGRIFGVCHCRTQRGWLTSNYAESPATREVDASLVGDNRQALSCGI